MFDGQRRTDLNSNSHSEWHTGSSGESSMPKLVSLAEAADQFGISVKTLRRRISDGTVRGYRVGRLIRVDMNDLLENLVEEIPTVGR